MRPDMSHANREFRFFGIFRESPPLHFYMLQFVGFAYLAYRFASRNYGSYGLIPDDKFCWLFPFDGELWPMPLHHILSGQFLYFFLQRPTPEGIHWMQGIVIAACGLGIVGVAPRWCAAVAFAVAFHVTGMMQACDAPFDGGDPPLLAMLILILSPSEAFYGWRNGFSLARRGVHFHWPVFLFIALLASYYTASGVNKVIDIGPHWPFSLHLERWGVVALERSLFVSSRYCEPGTTSMHLSYAFSVAAGIVTLLSEMFFLAVLFWPRSRWFFVGGMIALHTLVFLVCGINFVGNSALLPLCFDVNTLARNATLTYNPARPDHRRLVALARLFDWFRRIDVRPGHGSLTWLCETGHVFTGVDVVERVFEKCPALVPASLIFKLPGTITIARWLAHGDKTPTTMRRAA